MTLTRREALASINAVGGEQAAKGALAALGLGPSTHLQYQKLDYNGQAGKGAKVLILGAGIAGLVAAFELKRAGFQVRILEARQRVGGRNWTLRGGDEVEYLDGRTQTAQFAPGLYFNAGPARLPSQHRTILDYCSQLGVPLEVLVNTSHSAQVRPDLEQPAFSVRQALNDTRGHLAGLLATAINRDALDDQLSAEERSRLLTFLQGYGDLSAELVYEGSLRAGHGIAEPAPGSLPGFGAPMALDRLLHPELWGALLHTEYPEFSATMLQPVGGMDRIAAAFEQRLQDELQFGAVVRQLRQSKEGVTVTYDDAASGGSRQERADYLISTLPLPLLARLDTDFDAPFKAALHSTRNDQATKVAWEAPRFWEQKDRIYGGLSWLEHPARLLWYPSNELNTPQGLLVAGYVTGEGAADFGRKALADQYASSAEAVELLHPGQSSHLRNPLAVSWEQVAYSEGPWLQREHFPADAHALLEVPQGRVYLASDGLGQSGIGIWQESAANSARRVVGQLAEQVIRQRQTALAS
ncbi:flavin monoamine oxidase family protein [Pseudomonas sp. TE3610]